MPKSIHALPFCAPALLAAQLFSAAFEVQAACPTIDSSTNTVNVTGNTIGPNGATTGGGRISICPPDSGQLPSNANLTITAGGSIDISTSGNSGVKVETGATNNTIINNGSITTSTANSDGIQAANSGSITNNRTINVTGTGSRGIVAGDGNRIINNDDGRITTTLGRGIEAGSNNTITNRGDITATNSTDGAIYISGTGNSLTNTGNITTTTGRGVGGADGTSSSFTSLTNRGSETRTGSGVTTGQITGSTDGIRVGFIESLRNEAGALIEGEGGAGVALTGAARTTATVTNSGTIKGTTYGLDYGVHTIRTLTNNGTGLIQGRDEAGVKAAAIGTLTNNAGGRIVSTNNDGVRVADAISTLNNSGTISGGGHGVKAGSIDTLTNSGTGTITATGASGDGVNSTGAIDTLNNSGTISGGRHGVNALTVDLTNSGDITGGARGMANDTNRHALNLGAGDSTILNTGKITSARGRGISGLETTVITTLSNTVNSSRAAGTGVIKGKTDGIRVGFITNLTNNAGALIEGEGGAGVALTRATDGTATVTNSGTIKGTTFGLDYGAHTIRQLINNGTGLIQGRDEAGV